MAISKHVLTWRSILLTILSFLTINSNLVIFAQSDDTSLEKVHKSGALVVAIDPTYPPMEFEDKPGQTEGFDVDLATALAESLNVKVKFVVMNWDGILAGLNSRRYDVIISSMNITPERSTQVDFVEYLKMAQVFVVGAGSTIKSKEGLSGKVVAVQADTTSFSWVSEQQTKGLAIKEIKAFKFATEAFSALKVGQAEALVVDEPVGRFYAKQDKDSFKVSGEAVAAEPIGIAIRKDDQELKRALADALKKLKSDGGFARISTKWFGSDLGNL